MTEVEEESTVEVRMDEWSGAAWSEILVQTEGLK